MAGQSAYVLFADRPMPNPAAHVQSRGRQESSEKAIPGPNGALRCNAIAFLNPSGAKRLSAPSDIPLHAHCINRHMFYSLGIKDFLIGRRGRPNPGAALVGLTDYSSYTDL